MVIDLQRISGFGHPYMIIHVRQADPMGGLVFWLEDPHTARQQPAYCLKAHAFNTNRFFPLHNLQRLDTSYYDQSLQDTRIDSMGSPQALGCWCALRSWEQIAVFVSVGGNHFHGMNPKQMEKWHPIDLLTTFLFFIGVTIYIYRYSTIIVFREHG